MLASEMDSNVRESLRLQLMEKLLAMDGAMLSST